jgi:hypothetical protein
MPRDGLISAVPAFFHLGHAAFFHAFSATHDANIFAGIT